MSTLKYFLGAALVLGVVTLSVSSAADDKPKNTIKDIMKKAHGKDGLFNKVKAGTITADEKKELVALYTDLQKNKPPKGEIEAWMKTTGVIADAAKAFQEGKDE